MKTNKILSSFLLVFAVIFALPYCLSAQQVIVEVNGQPVFGEASILTTDAGEDITGTIKESQSNTSISIIRNNDGNYRWKVFVSAVNLPEGVTLKLYREGTGTNSSGGSAGGQISGPGSIIVGATPTEFLSGRFNRLNVPILFEIENISVVQPIGNQNYHLIFEVVN
ncbi:hypothetical protein BA6E_10328 [Bacteroidales bacterium 6E]|nr:hypothetical protein BA6E_10328 [Bacteroidales bacterium 6E]